LLQTASPTSDTHLYPRRQCLDADSPIGVVREADAEFRVELGLVLRIGLGQYIDDVTSGFDECSGLGLCEPAVRLSAAPSRSGTSPKTARSCCRQMNASLVRADLPGSTELGAGA
jgi:hypothetical protein